MKLSTPFTLYKRTLKSGKKIYYFQYRKEDGKRSTPESCRTTNKAEALKYVQKRIKENFCINSNITFKTFSKGFFDEGSEYNTWNEINGHKTSISTLIAYQKALKMQLKPFLDEIPLNKITVYKLKEWVMWCSKRNSAKTVNNAQGVLNIILKNAVEKGLLNDNPLKTIQYRKVSKKDRNLLTVEEIKLLLRTWMQKDEVTAKAMLLAFITGMRIGEICALDKDHTKNNYFDVAQSYSDRTGLGSTKTRVNRFVPYPETFPFPKTESKWIFEEKGEPIKSHNVYNNFVRTCDKLGIDRKERGLTVHTARNFFISYMKGQNISELKIKAVAGHADTSITDIYTYWKPEMFKEIYYEQNELLKCIMHK